MELNRELLDQLREAATNSLDPVTKKLMESIDDVDISCIFKHQNDIMRAMMEASQKEFISAMENLYNKIVEGTCMSNVDFETWLINYKLPNYQLMNTES